MAIETTFCSAASESAAMAAEAHRPHALVLPFPGVGHVNPMLHFAHRLSSAGILVTFVYSNRMHHRLQLHRSKLQEQEQELGEKEAEKERERQQQLFRVEVIPDGLPTDEKYKPSYEEFWSSLQLVKKGMVDLLERSLSTDHHPVSCIISDNFLSSIQEAANKFGLPRADFWSGPAAAYSIGVHIPVLMAEGFIPYKGQNELITCIPGLFPMSASDYPKSFLAEDTSNPFFQFISKGFEAAKEADWILVNTVYDLESRIVDGLRAKNFSVHTVGPLLSPGTHTSSESAKNEACLQWLDKQPPLSVIYVAFGTVATLSPAEVQALALGLELSHQLFLWALPPNSVEHLPDAFATQTEEQGLIISWAPQVAVLSHPSVGGFISHCGWNSTMESLYMGVPIIGWPKQAEQYVNLRVITEKWKVGIAMEGEGEGQGRTLSKEGVERAVRALMEGEEGRAARKSVVEMREGVKAAMEEGGSSKQNVDDFIGDICKRGGGHGLKNWS